MKLADDNDSKIHLEELKVHFQTMLQCRNNLIKIGSTMSDTQFNIIIMSSLPEFYWSTLQTLTASEHMKKLSGSQENGIKANGLIDFIIEKAQHWVINDDYTKNAELALAAYMQKTAKHKRKRRMRIHLMNHVEIVKEQTTKLLNATPKEEPRKARVQDKRKTPTKVKL